MNWPSVRKEAADSTGRCNTLMTAEVHQFADNDRFYEDLFVKPSDQHIDERHFMAVSTPATALLGFASGSGERLMIRIDAIWQATEPLDMRAGTPAPTRRWRGSSRSSALRGCITPTCLRIDAPIG
jgi:hypothetical protein